MKKFALVLWFAVPSVLSAQTAAQTTTDSAPPEKVTRVVRVHYGNAQTLAHLAGTGTEAKINADNALRAIVIEGWPAAVAAVEQTIHELDVPSSVPVSKDVEITVSVLAASNKAGALSGGEVPVGLAPAVKQLAAIFPYKNYQLLSSMLVRSREGGRSESRGVMQGISMGAEPSYPIPYKLFYDEATVSVVDDKPMIHLHNFGFTTTVRITTGPQSWQASDVTLLTDLDLREGQKVVVGKANMENSDSALFVILGARLVE